MSRIVHLSDLHFGRVDPALETPLLDTVACLAPDLVVVSGDLTQRARRGQFAAARRFLDRLPGPVLCVPGNHDVPLENLLLRFLNPFGRYRRFINPDLEPVHSDDRMVVVGVNTVNRFAWQRGRIGRRRLARIAERFSGSGSKLRVGVLHHPLEHGPETAKRLTRGAGKALRAMSDCGADVVLSGHLHIASVQPFRSAPDLLFVQAGTGLSTRLRDRQGNAFNQLDYSGDRLRVLRWTSDPEQERAFTVAGESEWIRRETAWTQVPVKERVDKAER